MCFTIFCRLHSQPEDPGPRTVLRVKAWAAVGVLACRCRDRLQHGFSLCWRLLRCHCPEIVFEIFFVARTSFPLRLSTRLNNTNLVCSSGLRAHRGSHADQAYPNLFRQHARFVFYKTDWSLVFTRVRRVRADPRSGPALLLLFFCCFIAENTAKEILTKHE